MFYTDTNFLYIKGTDFRSFQLKRPQLEGCMPEDLFFTLKGGTLWNTDYWCSAPKHLRKNIQKKYSDVVHTSMLKMPHHQFFHFI